LYVGIRLSGLRQSLPPAATFACAAAATTSADAATCVRHGYQTGTEVRQELQCGVRRHFPVLHK